MLSTSCVLKITCDISLCAPKCYCFHSWSYGLFSCRLLIEYFIGQGTYNLDFGGISLSEMKKIFLVLRLTTVKYRKTQTVEFIAVSSVVRMFNNQGEVPVSLIFKKSTDKVNCYRINCWSVGRTDMQSIMSLLRSRFPPFLGSGHRYKHLLPAHKIIVLGQTKGSESC